MPATYTLYYFDLAGRGEPIRLTFALCDTPFNDNRFKREEWPALKTSGKCPYGQVPILEIESGGSTHTIAESSAICDYIIAAHGDGSGMKRTDPIEIAKVSEAVSVMMSFLMKLGSNINEKNLEKKMSDRKEMVETSIPFIMSALDGRIQDTGFVSEGTITIADVLIESLVKSFESGFLDAIPKDILKPYKNINKCAENVRNHPKIKAYYASKS
mmetsp:Transcript_15002/g.22338  ORF Transcript_15002/g.22338 Transcript_15002/m.22338 type:complete len:214 (+) Transcript_15002:65-706(+)